jgi:hypothetical protein
MIVRLPACEQLFDRNESGHSPSSPTPLILHQQVAENACSTTEDQQLASLWSRPSACVLTFSAACQSPREEERAVGRIIYPDPLMAEDRYGPPGDHYGGTALPEAGGILPERKIAFPARKRRREAGDRIPFGWVKECADSDNKESRRWGAIEARRIGDSVTERSFLADYCLVCPRNGSRAIKRQ